MGMFDSLYDATGIEWQTKAFNCELDRYQIGDRIGPPFTYQAKVLGGPRGEDSRYAYATIREGVLVEVPADRDETLPLLDYYGGWEEAPDGR